MGNWAELTGGVSGPWWVSSERRFLCCRVVMLLAWLLVAMIWEACMLPRRSVSSGSPIFTSSSVMVPKEVEGWGGDVGMFAEGHCPFPNPLPNPSSGQRAA